MKREDIIRMAREVADIETDYNGREEFIFDSYGVERFANLVYAEAHKDGLDDFEAVVLPAAIKAEREACAKVCDELVLEHPGRADLTAKQCAFAIRERGAP